jgi:hypothetical protein
MAKAEIHVRASYESKAVLKTAPETKKKPGGRAATGHIVLSSMCRRIANAVIQMSAG